MVCKFQYKSVSGLETTNHHVNVRARNQFPKHLTLNGDFTNGRYKAFKWPETTGIRKPTNWSFKVRKGHNVNV